MRTIVLLVILGLYLAIPGNAAAQEESSFSFTSDAGDYIGQGQTVLFTPDTASFNVSVSPDRNRISGSVFPFAGGFWFFRIEAPVGQALDTGVYEQAARFQTAATPALEIFGDGRGCNLVTGRFEVLEAVYGPNGYIERFHATFEQHCEGLAPALFGEIRVVNPPPPPPLTVQVTVNRKGALDRFGAIRLSGTVTCSKETTVFLSGVAGQKLTRFALATGSFWGSVVCTTSPTVWSAQLSPTGNVPFGPGMALADITANGYDSNYGNFATVEIEDGVQLNRSTK